MISAKQSMAGGGRLSSGRLKEFSQRSCGLHISSNNEPRITRSASSNLNVSEKSPLFNGTATLPTLDKRFQPVAR